MPVQLANGPLAPPQIPGLGISMNDASMGTQPNLSSMAASANETLAHSLIPSIFDPEPSQLSEPGFHTGDGITGGVAEADSQGRAFSWTSSTQPPRISTDSGMPRQVQEAVAFPRPIAINPNLNKSTVFVEETGTSTKSQKAKQRSAFNPQRKKEVQEMRLRGVCIRCKMLKKPCGIETPCKPCNEIDNSRLWGPCSRWDFKKDLKFYTTPLHSSFAQSDVNSLKNQISFQPFEGYIAVSLVKNKSAIIEVPAQQGRNGSHAIHPQYGISMQKRHYQKSEDIYMFSIGRKDFTAKLQQYLDATLADFLAEEASPLIRSTLEMAHRLSKEKDHKLLQMVLELWVLTYLLTATDLTTTFEAVPATQTSPPQVHQLLSEGDNMYSYSVLSSQLRAAVAERASEVKKKTMAAFEAQFMKGPTTKSAKSDRFETILASVILVNAAERYIWLFKVFEQGLPDYKPWPLDAGPSQLAHQAEKVALHLEFLLRVRHVSPGTQFGADGRLTLNENIDENSDNWFRIINMKREDLIRLKDSNFDPARFQSLDGAFFSTILHPQPVLI